MWLRGQQDTRKRKDPAHTLSKEFESSLDYIRLRLKTKQAPKVELSSVPSAGTHVVHREEMKGESHQLSLHTVPIHNGQGGEAG